jgi:hypothetical protein
MRSNALVPTIQHGAERAEHKRQRITGFPRQKREEFRGGFESQPLQKTANFFRTGRITPLYVRYAEAANARSASNLNREKTEFSIVNSD